MTLWDDLITAYNTTNLASVFSSLNISDVPTANHSGLKVASLSQWILESARGTSLLATNHLNFGGLKWRNELEGFATRIEYDASDGPDYYCKFASLNDFIRGYWKFITRSPYTGWEDRSDSPSAYIEFIGSIYATDPNYITKVKNLFSEAEQLLGLPDDGITTPLGTWIKETDEAIYLMEGGYYIDKLDKVSDGSEFSLVITNMKNWFTSDLYPAPGTMKIAIGSVAEPEAKPIDHPGTGDPTNGTPVRKPTVKFDSANSTNFNRGRSGNDIDTIVVHNTVGSFNSAINWFKNSSSNVSAHYVISRQGEIVQMVNDEDTAWHAGNRNVNRRSIGIEHEADLSHTGFTTAMENASIALIKYLMQEYNVSVGRVLPHRRDWGGSTSTSCPNLVWSSEGIFNAWKQSSL